MHKFRLNSNGENGLLELQPGPNRLGRGADNHVQISDPSVSGVHCEVIVDDALYVRDLNSTNGTYVDGRRVQESPLLVGQTLRLGSVDLIYESGGAAKTSDTPVRITSAPSMLAPSPTPPIGVDERFTAPSTARTFGQDLSNAFTYPLRDGIILLICGTVFFTLFDALQSIARPTFMLGRSGLLIVGLFSSGYLCAFLQKILVASSNGESRLPDWPDFTDWWNDIIRPLLLFTVAGVVSFGPALACLVWAEVAEEPAAQIAFFATLGLGLIYFPMAVLAVCISDGFMAVTPLTVIPSILRIPGPYIIACIVLLLICGVNLLSEHVLEEMIPISFLKKLPGTFLALYFSIVEMHVLGVLYYHHRKKLGWY
jgi:hypothetical protein